MKKTGDSYENGFNDGARCAWEEYSELIDKVLNDVVDYGLGLNPDVEGSLTSFKFNLENIKKRLES